MPKSLLHILSWGAALGLPLALPDLAWSQDALNEVQASAEAEADVAANVAQKVKRAWGPEQAEGPPDTEGAGDATTAWASRTADSQKEWLLCEYAEAVMATAVVIHENDAPGAVEKVSVFDDQGQEVEVWTGTDPTPRTAGRGTSIIPIKPNFKVKKIKVYLDSPAVTGWNEIDAVGLRSKDETQWAQVVTASSTYAADIPEPTVTAPASELQSLKADVKELKTEMQELQSDIKELKELVKALKQDK